MWQYFLDANKYMKNRLFPTVDTVVTEVDFYHSQEV